MTRCEAAPSGAREEGRGRAAAAAREIAGGLVVLAVYLAFTHAFAGARAVSDAHGRSLLALERWAHLDVGPELNGVLIRHGWLGALAAWEYATTYVLATFGFLGYLWWRRNPAYPWARNLLIWITLIAICCFAAWPSTPPRLLPGEGYTDIIALHHPPATWGTGAVSAGANPYAAMPSLHIGWVAWIGVAAVRARCGAAVAWLCGLHLVVTGLVIVATAAHYVVDIPGGLLLVPAAAGAEALRARFVRAFSPSAESPGAPQVVGAVAEFAGPGPAAGRVRALLAERLPDVPALTRLSGLRRTRGEVDLVWHVRECAVPAPGDRRALDGLVARLAAEPFDPVRPPWRLHLVRGGGELPDAVVALVRRSPADGARLLDLLRSVLERPSEQAGSGEASRKAVLPAPAPSDLAVPAAVGAPGPGYLFGTVTLPLERVRDVARAAGVRVGDLLAALTAEAVGGRGTQPPGGRTLRVAVPSKLWPDGGHPALDGSAGVRWLDVPIDARPFRERLEEMRARERAGPARPAALRSAGVLRPASPASADAGESGDPLPGAMVVNVRGPSGPLLAAGTPVRDVHLVLPPPAGLPVAVTALSKDGALHVSVMAEARALPEPDRFADGLLRAFEKLAAEFGADTGPGRSGERTGTP
ncbi:bifunctional phosphatase PAP2/O-acyltransferase family protein [Actinomadura opuntiae]|uniref:bifunctional phosphatase PAP2/O-acyltransferase family protein n=1 Tax=Actinomadura sp. OS1-43 TaxID=604315 RepID=UPI00255AE3D0|nr:phosphatase PAP2 family protein [Actinomadura sp. OS1-43]MDL4817090.1 phosphatase PAP2 family protein [Actinomadura sp. OS1-43]